ncbi:hypothetical protein JAAARDRAFT_43339 [Jaapia argillacea MUCL 33604]|uniref:HNH nuclease domain-containing protein n=1 Tax=Jaapia argillacea MUCL 33604 TaxID=933084 RepID=A0A067QDB5_9AGAM|nr:hypothetical protein JAAARDRAFT_43339 [Jaapia argillacea MUCL 33604]
MPLAGRCCANLGLLVWRRFTRRQPHVNFQFQPVVLLSCEFEPQQWAHEILVFLRNRETNELDEGLKPLCDLATEYLNHLLIAARNPGGKKTPQDSTNPTPDLIRLQSIERLLSEATTGRKQSALEELVYRRDGYHCALTHYSFKPPGNFVVPRCAHILPFSFRDKPLILRALDAFTVREITAEVVQANVNHPSNAFNVESNAHESFDRLEWGIEALQQTGASTPQMLSQQWKYSFREIRNCAATVCPEDGDEIVFCDGNTGSMIGRPIPSFCNLKLALARVMEASGVSDIITELYGYDDDDEEIVNQPVYLEPPPDIRVT